MITVKVMKRTVFSGYNGENYTTCNDTNNDNVNNYKSNDNNDDYYLCHCHVSVLVVFIYLVRLSLSLVSSLMDMRNINMIIRRRLLLLLYL